MDERQYVNAIARRIKCNGKKKKEIKRQLLADITMRTEQGEDAMRTTIELLDVQDYATIQENAIPQMQSVLNQETMENVRKQITEDWGQRESFGVLYTMELVQGNEHFAVGEVTVSYENATVTYRLTYDREMQLAGLFIR